MPRDFVFPGADGGPMSPVEMNELTESVSKHLAEAGLPKWYIHAWEKTGMLLNAMNVDLYDEEDIEEWDAAVAEGKARYGEE